jgi:hypothetical protein
MVSQDNENSPIQRDIEVLECTYVLDPRDNYRGLSYGELITRWTRWLLGACPDNYEIEDFVFLRGNIGHHTDPKAFYRAPDTQVEQGTAILVPIITTFYMLGDVYEATVIEDENRLRHALNEHVNAAGPFWATIRMMDIPNAKTKKIVNNLEGFRFESPVFNLTISENNPFLNKMDVPISPGTRTALAGGYFVILKDLPPSRFEIRFGGKGLGDFFTDSLYEIEIVPKLSNFSKDISGHDTSPEKLSQKK